MRAFYSYLIIYQRLQFQFKKKKNDLTVCNKTVYILNVLKI